MRRQPNVVDLATSTHIQEHIEEVEAMLALARGRVLRGEPMPADVQAEFDALQAEVDRYRKAHP